MRVIIDRWSIDHAETAFLPSGPEIIAGSDRPGRKSDRKAGYIEKENPV